MFFDYNNEPSNIETPKDLATQKTMLLNYMDIIKLGLAGNLRDYRLKTHNGQILKGSDINYRGSGNAGYSASPKETINYIDAHDNYTLWDQIIAKAPFKVTGRTPVSATTEEKARMQNLGLSIIALGQGIPFFQAGSDMLRSKSGDGDSYNSGDWFNKLDFTYYSNNWGVGLPPAWRNKKEWLFWQPRLASSGMKPSKNIILSSVANFQKMLKIRKSSQLFRLQSAEEIMDRVIFLDSEDDKESPGIIVMFISDKITGKENLDTERKSVIAIFNATREPVKFRNNSLVGIDLKLFPVLNENLTLETGTVDIDVPADSFMKQTGFEKSTGTIVVPPRSTVVYYEPE